MITTLVDSLNCKIIRILSHNAFLLSSGRQYILEKQDDPGKAVDMEATLDTMGTFEFRLLREGKILCNSSDKISKVFTNILLLNPSSEISKTALCIRFK